MSDRMILADELTIFQIELYRAKHEEWSTFDRIYCRKLPSPRSPFTHCSHLHSNPEISPLNPPIPIQDNTDFEIPTYSKQDLFDFHTIKIVSQPSY